MSLEFITTSEASKRFNTSISSIKRLINIIKANKQEALHLKKGKKLNTGLHQWLISLDYLKNHFESSSWTTENTKVEPRTDLRTSLEKTIEILQEQLKTKDEQIKDYNEQFKAFQELELQAMERLKEQNHLIYQLQIIAEERREKLEAFHNKKTKRPEFKAEDAEEVKEEFNDNEEHNFNDWLNSFD